MENKKSIRSLLGFKQEELALLLKVSRSQLSLYELGKRSLPLHAMEKLALLVSQLQNPAVENEQNKNTTEVDKKVVQHLQGGNIAKILVKEGDIVKKDQVLIELDIVQSKSEAEAMIKYLTTVTPSMKG